MILERGGLAQDVVRDLLWLPRLRLEDGMHLLLRRLGVGVLIANVQLQHLEPHALHGRLVDLGLQRPAEGRDADVAARGERGLQLDAALALRLYHDLLGLHADLDRNVGAQAPLAGARGKVELQGLGVGDVSAPLHLLGPIVGDGRDRRVLALGEEHAQALVLASVAREVELLAEEGVAPSASDDLLLVVGMALAEVEQRLCGILLNVPQSEAVLLDVTLLWSLGPEGQLHLEVVGRHRPQAPDLAHSARDTRREDQAVGDGDGSACHEPLLRMLLNVHTPALIGTGER
mmetsp:Transcript_11429/g.26000  ORF Transcript_11429/g.26000 Transcript_11429/m.26000 type:complete len:289 (-) Transcript_11429:37-903(-)